MSYCKNCGTEIKEDVKFCPECGTKSTHEFIEEPIKISIVKLIVKRIVNLIRWVFGIFLIFASFGGFIAEDYLLASLVLICGLTLIPLTIPFIKDMFKQRKLLIPSIFDKLKQAKEAFKEHFKHVRDEVKVAKREADREREEYKRKHKVKEEDIRLAWGIIAIIGVSILCILTLPVIEVLKYLATYTLYALAMAFLIIFSLLYLLLFTTGGAIIILVMLVIVWLLDRTD